MQAIFGITFNVKRAKKEVRFDSLLGKSGFHFEGNYYMKCRSEDYVTNAVNLKTFELVCFSQLHKVTPIKNVSIEVVE